MCFQLNNWLRMNQRIGILYLRGSAARCQYCSALGWIRVAWPTLTPPIIYFVILNWWSFYDFISLYVCTFIVFPLSLMRLSPEPVLPPVPLELSVYWISTLAELIILPLIWHPLSVTTSIPFTFSSYAKLRALFQVKSDMQGGGGKL